MPDLVGLSTAEALAEIKKLGLNVQVDGEGAVIINQFPTKDTMLYLGDEVVVVTN